MEDQILNEVSGVTEEVAAPVEAQPVQPTAQTIEQAAQPTVDGQGTPETQESVSYERFKEVNDSKNALQQQLQMSMQQNQIQLQHQQANQAPQPLSKLQELAAKLKSTDDDGTGSINLDEAGQMMDVFQGLVDDINQTRRKDQIDSYLVQNPEFKALVGYETPRGPQYTPDFNKMMEDYPAAEQHLDSMKGQPLEQMKQALAYAREYKKSKVTQQQLSTINVPGQPLVAGAPPSLSAIPTSSGVNTAATWQQMTNAEFLKAADSLVKT